MNSLNQINLVLLLVSLFTIKHFIFDYWLQNEYQLDNKSIYFHSGGILHSALHAISTFIILGSTAFILDLPLKISFILSMVELSIHYHVDWIKSNVQKDLRYGVENKGFWILFGIDQTLHMLTYVFIIYIFLLEYVPVEIRFIMLIPFLISIVFLLKLFLDGLAAVYDIFVDRYRKSAS